MPADELAAWRERRHQAQATRRAAAERRRETGERRARETFEAWAAEHAPVIEALARYSGDPRFLGQLADQVTGRWGPPRKLSEAQIDAAFRVMADQAEHQRIAAEREAARRPAPIGRQQITGQVVKVSYDRPGNRFGPEHKMTVSCDGYAIRVSVPRPLAEWARANRSDVLHRDWRPNDSDYVISERWTDALKGLRVTLTATIEPSRKDTSFGSGSRPASVQIAEPERPADREPEAGS